MSSLGLEEEESEFDIWMFWSGESDFSLFFFLNYQLFVNYVKLVNL